MLLLLRKVWLRIVNYSLYNTASVVIHLYISEHTHIHTQHQSGLSAYNNLEDIDSDEEEVMSKAEDLPPTTSTVARPPTKTNSEPLKPKPSKEELLLMMERVDRDISALENQITSLQKKQVGTCYVCVCVYCALPPPPSCVCVMMIVCGESVVKGYVPSCVRVVNTYGYCVCVRGEYVHAW